MKRIEFITGGPRTLGGITDVLLDGQHIDVLSARIDITPTRTTCFIELARGEIVMRQNEQVELSILPAPSREEAPHE